jgi:polygalacturonase
MPLSKKVLIAVLVTAAISCYTTISAAPADTLCNVRDFGAAGDGQTLDTLAIQKAIDSFAEKGGGTAYFPPGRYLSGTLFLKSGITLHLEAGAVLLGSTDLNDYPPRTAEFRSYTDVNYVCRSLIYAEKAERIAIVGHGTIDGQGQNKAFQFTDGSAYQHYKKRPYLLRFIECRDVIVRDVTLTNAAMWAQHYLACDNIVVDGITVHNRVNENTDGLDVDNCRNMRIANCNISSKDDAIVLKSTSPRLCENITVTNCTLSSDCYGFKLGTESIGGFRDIVLSNCVIYDTNQAGLALESVDGGILERVCISNITMRDTRCGIFIRLGNRARPYLAKMPSDRKSESGEVLPVPAVGTLQDITISNVQATGLDSIGCSITGLPGHPVRNVTLSNIRLQFAGGGTAEQARAVVPEKENSYPKYNIFGPLPAYSFYVRHAENIRFDHMQLGYEKPEARPALVCDDITDLSITSLGAKTPMGDGPVIYFNNVVNALITGCLIDPHAHSFLQVDGKTSRRISLTGNNAEDCNNLIKRGPDTDSAVIFKEVD